jgi:hypothetical protein
MTTSRRRTAETELRFIDLYSPEYSENSDLKSVEGFLKSFFHTVKVSVKPPILSFINKTELDRFSETLVLSRVKDPSKDHQSFEPMYGEIDFEKRAALGKARVGGVVYDGRKLEDIFASHATMNVGINHAGIVFTQRLVSTFSRDDLRHHLRTVVCGFPSIVSIPGVVEAPAKPREYYLLKQGIEMKGCGELQLEELKSGFRGRFVDYGDPQINDVLKGLALQAVVFHLTLKPFCDKPKCRFFNAHWQEDLVRSQITDVRLCDKHKRLLEELREHPTIDW